MRNFLKKNKMRNTKCEAFRAKKCENAKDAKCEIAKLVKNSKNFIHIQNYKFRDYDAKIKAFLHFLEEDSFSDCLLLILHY